MKIVTGYAGEAHITSNDDQGLLQGIFGTGNYILPVRNRFAATLISSNELQIADGEGLLQGVHFRVEPDTVDSLTIENGSQGMQRIDLVCARYETNAETEIESVSWVVKKGTPAASNPATPSVTPGDLLAGDTLAEFPIYSIRLNGITIQSVTLLATILSPQSLIGNTSITGIGDGTITGALSALNASLSPVDISSQLTIDSPYIDMAKLYCFGGHVYQLFVRITGNMPTGWTGVLRWNQSIGPLNTIAVASAHGNTDNLSKGLSAIANPTSMNINLESPMTASSNYALFCVTWIH